MTLVKYDPFRSLISFPKDVNRWFGFDLEDSDTVWAPAVDVSETETAYEVKAEIPGMKKEDIKVKLEQNVLTLSGERKQESETKDKNYHRIERSYGSFKRSFQLPTEVKAEEIKAGYKDGVLTVEIPKVEQAKPKEIAVK